MNLTARKQVIIKVHENPQTSVDQSEAMLWIRTGRKEPTSDKQRVTDVGAQFSCLEKIYGYLLSSNQ